MPLSIKGSDRLRGAKMLSSGTHPGQRAFAAAPRAPLRRPANAPCSQPPSSGRTPAELPQQWRAAAAPRAARLGSLRALPPYRIRRDQDNSCDYLDHLYDHRAPPGVMCLNSSQPGAWRISNPALQARTEVTTDPADILLRLSARRSKCIGAFSIIQHQPHGPAAVPMRSCSDPPCARPKRPHPCSSSTGSLT
jgi:hypothetical protein